MAAWQEVFEKTSTAAAPWYLVPADNRWYSRAVVSELLRTTLKNMNMTWPPLEPEVDPDEVRRRLACAILPLAEPSAWHGSSHGSARWREASHSDGGWLVSPE